MKYTDPLRPGDDVLFVFLRPDGTIREAFATTVERFQKERAFDGDAFEHTSEEVAVCISTAYGRRLEFLVPPDRIERLAAADADWSVPFVLVREDDSFRRLPPVASDDMGRLRASIRRAARDLSNPTQSDR